VPDYSPVIISARPDAPFKTFREMTQWAKANPGKLIYGHTDPWGAADLPWKQIMKLTGITGKVVPHDGGGPTLTAILGGHIDATGGLATQSMPHIKAGKLRVLAVLDYQRETDLPDVPTAKEEGIDVVYLMWRGVLAPKGTSRPIIDKLAVAFKKMTEDKSVIGMPKRFWR
jgi:tripartite-type tricarboxylate transporter receptor subunit TctC